MERKPIRITSCEAARLADCSPATLHNYDGELMPERVGVRGVRIYERERVEQWATARKQARVQR